jgi:ferredoxin-NADP reductase
MKQKLEYKRRSYKEYFIDSSWISFINSRFTDFYLYSKLIGEVLEVKEECDKVKTYVFRMNPNWKGAKAGQHISIQVEINGRILHRFYSLNTIDSRRISLTIKGKDGGIVSNFIHENWKKGTKVQFGDVKGDFLESKWSGKDLILVAGGSGITPVYSILNYFKSIQYSQKLDLFYFVRSEKDVILKKELVEFQTTLPNFKLHLYFSDNQEGLTPELVQKELGDFSNQFVYVCGPESLYKASKEIFKENPFYSEHFQTIKREANPNKERVEVTLKDSNRVVSIRSDIPILDALEEEGIFPASGCRMGICHTCTCKKETGSTLNQLENSVSSSENELIQICVTRAESNLELEL